MSRFGLWLGAATLSTLGDSVTYFAIAWTASGFGAGTASRVLAVEGIPLLLLVLVGGIVADRYGIRRTMIACDVAMVIVMAGFALGASVSVPVWSLLVVAAVSSTAAGLRRPADGVFPRLFGTGDALQRRMATVGGAEQTARIAGPALGGLLLGLGGLVLTSSLDAVSFAAVGLALVLVRPPYERAPVPATQAPVSAWRSLLDGLAAARRTPGVPAMILAVFCLAGAVLPLVSLCLPLLGRDRGWSAGQTGVVGAAWTAGGLLVTVVVARRGAPRAVVALAGPLVGVVGVALLVASKSPVLGFAGMCLVGIGTSLLTSHLFPVFAEVAPEEMLARFWSLLHLAQSLPTTVLMPVLGAVAAAVGIGSALAVVVVLLLATAAAAEVVRRAPTAVREPRPTTQPMA